MSVTLHVPMSEVSGAVRESARCVLAQKRVTVLKPDGTPMSARELDALLREISNNAAQGVAFLDTNPANQMEVL